MEFKHYTASAAMLAAVMHQTFQKVEATDFTRLLCGICVVAFMVNFAAALWVYTTTHVIDDNSWEIRVCKWVFVFTGILSPYTSLSVLFPKRFAWYLFALFAMICIIVTTLFCCYENVVDAARWMRSKMTTDDQVLPITDAAAMARFAAEEDQQNLVGSGPSPNLPWLSATAPAVIEEQPNLNG